MIRNIFLGILLSITIFFSIFSFTILNDSFINHIEKKENINSINIKEDLKIENKVIYYLIDISLIVVTGLIFLHTKSKHDLNKIYVVSFIFSVLIYGLIYILLPTNNKTFYLCYLSFIRYYLAFEICLLLYVIFKKYLLNKILK